MITNVYVDGFNLYYGALKKTPYKWLDLDKLCRLMLPKNTIQEIKYFTARVQPRSSDPDVHIRQNTYLRALATLPNLRVIEGEFFTKKIRMPLASPPHQMVEVIKTEEKGSDVNLAIHLLNDAYLNHYELAILISNDSDLFEALRIVRYQMNKRVGVFKPQAHRGYHLNRIAHFDKKIPTAFLEQAQFSNTLKDNAGVFLKPSSW